MEQIRARRQRDQRLSRFELGLARHRIDHPGIGVFHGELPWRLVEDVGESGVLRLDDDLVAGVQLAGAVADLSAAPRPTELVAGWLRYGIHAGQSGWCRRTDR